MDDFRINVETIANTIAYALKDTLSESELIKFQKLMSRTGDDSLMLAPVGCEMESFSSFLYTIQDVLNHFGYEPHR